MATAPTFQAEQLTFADCRVLSFQVGRPGQPLPPADELASFNFTINSNQGVDFENALIRVELHIAVEARRTDTEVPAESVGELRTETVFQLQDMASLTQPQPDGSRALPELVGATALGLALSTSRGVLLMLSANTVLRQAILPVVNPLQLLRSAQPTPPAAQ